MMTSSIAPVSTKSAHGACSNRNIPPWLFSSSAKNKNKFQCLVGVTEMSLKKMGLQG